MSPPDQDSEDRETHESEDQACKQESEVGEDDYPSDTYVPPVTQGEYWHVVPGPGSHPQGTVPPQNQLLQDHDDNTFLEPPSQGYTDPNAFANEALDPVTDNSDPIPPIPRTENNPWLILPPSDEPRSSFGSYGVSGPLSHDNSAQGSVPPRFNNLVGKAPARSATNAPTSQVARPLTLPDEQLRLYQRTNTATPPVYNQGNGTWQNPTYVQYQYSPQSGSSATAYQYPPAPSNDTHQEDYPSQ